MPWAPPMCVRVRVRVLVCECEPPGPLARSVSVDGAHGVLREQRYSLVRMCGFDSFAYLE
eukprot:325927-Prymnesium_polylepis.1